MIIYGPIALILMVFLLTVFLVALIHTLGRIRQGLEVRVRTIAGFDAARRALAHAAEAGHPLHLSPGPGAIGESASGSAETLAGLTLVETLSAQAALTGTPLVVTTDDAATLPLAENVVRHAYAAAGRVQEAPLIGRQPARTVEGYGQGVRLLAHRDRMAYAAAATDLIEHEGAMHAVTSGGFGPEYLLLSEAQGRAGVHAVAGAVDPQALATMAMSAEHTLLGEEIYSAGAYLGRYASHLASLRAQDSVRLVVIALIVLGALVATVLPPQTWTALLRLLSLSAFAG